MQYTYNKKTFFHGAAQYHSLLHTAASVCYLWMASAFLFLLASGLTSLVNGFISSGLVSTGTWNWPASTFLTSSFMLQWLFCPGNTHQYADLKVVGLFASAELAGGSCLRCRFGACNRKKTFSSLIYTCPSSIQVILEPLQVVTICWVLDTMGVRCSFSAAMSLLPVLTWDGFCHKQRCCPPFLIDWWCNFNSSVQISHLYFCMDNSDGADGWSLQLFVVFECG